MKKNDRKDWLEWQRKVIREEYVTDEEIERRTHEIIKSGKRAIV